MSLATINKNGTPNVIGVAFVKVISSNQIVITDNYMTQTKDNIKNNKNICIALWNKDWSGFKLVGEAKYLTKGQWKIFIEEMKENQGLPAKGAILVTIRKIIRLH